MRAYPGNIIASQQPDSKALCDGCRKLKAEVWPNAAHPMPVCICTGHGLRGERHRIVNFGTVKNILAPKWCEGKEKE